MIRKKKEGRTFPKGEKGFTLIEVLFAMVIFAVGILAIGALQITAIKGNSDARGNTEAVTIAMDKVEALCSDYNALPDDGVTESETANPGYTLTWESKTDDIIENTKTLSVKVAWSEEGQNRDLTIVRVVPKIVP